MRSPVRRLVAGSTLSQLGNWVNVTAVMVLLQQHYGAALVSAYFLARTVTPFLFARPLVGLVAEQHVPQVWASAQGILALMMLALAFVGSNIIALLILLALAGVLQSATSSWIMQIVGAVSGPDQKATITAIATGTSVAVVAGPSIGGLLALVGGLLPVFLFDAVTFAAAAVLVPWKRAMESPVKDVPAAGMKDAIKSISRAFVPVHPGGGRRLRLLAVFWVAFGLFGGLLTAAETPVFADLKRFNADQIGLAISAYGFGGLVIFVASTFWKFSTGRLATALVLVVGVGVWSFGEGWGLYVAFFITGLGFSLVNSAARVSFSESFSSTDVPVSQSWAWVNQLSLLTSVLSYFAAFVYFSIGGTTVPILSGVVALSVLCALVGVQSDIRSRRPVASSFGESVNTEQKGQPG